MKKLLASALTAFTLSAGSSAYAEEFVAENTILIRHVIANQTMGPVYERMNEFLFQKVAPKEVNLIIDSPGGSVIAGFKFISQMKALQGRGTKFSCYVPGMAASMAFHILTQCDKRTVLDESGLLWHRARIFVLMGIITAPVGHSIAKDLQLLDNIILSSVEKAMGKGMSQEEILYHFEQESMHVGQNLCKSSPNFCTSKAYIPGLLEASQNNLLPTTKAPREEKIRNLFDSVESLVYVHNKFLLSIKQMLLKQ